MKKLVFALFCLFSFALPSAVQAADTEKVEFACFVSPSCVHCNKLKREYWDDLREQYKDRVNFVLYDISQPGNDVIFSDTADAYGIKHKGYPAVAVGETYLLGYPNQIRTMAPAAIEKALQNHEKTNIVFHRKNDTEGVFKQITFWAIIGSGLVDGINPCAFAVIVFFISFLTVYKYNRREIILVGSAYCVAVFVAYVLIGVGMFKFLYAMQSFSYVIKAFYILTAAVCLLFFVLSLYDFWIYRKTKKSDKMLLQLPANLKVRIHKIMGFFLRDKQDGNAWRLVLAALAVGFCVSLVEAVCTGQVYAPTIVLIMQDPAYRARAVAYLLLYNVMFLLPLVLIFVLSVLGYESKGFNDFLKRHLGLTKLLLCAVFLGLFLLVAGNI